VTSRLRGLSRLTAALRFALGAWANGGAFFGFSSIAPKRQPTPTAHLLAAPQVAHAEFVA
jgi:hypothetical protein